MEHWLPLFHEKLETGFDYVPIGAIVLDYQIPDACNSRWELILDCYDARSTIAAKNIGKFAIASIIFFLFGYNLAYGISEGGYIGSFSMWSAGSEIATGYSDSSDWFFQTMFVCATV